MSRCWGVYIMEKGVSILLIHVHVSENDYMLLSEKAKEIDMQIGTYCAEVLSRGMRTISEMEEQMMVLREEIGVLKKKIAELDAVIEELESE